MRWIEIRASRIALALLAFGISLSFCFSLCFSFTFSMRASAQETFRNPIIAHGADPSVILVNGMYYSVQGGCPHQGSAPVLCIRASAMLPGLGRAVPVVVWTAPAFGPGSADIWAPQIEFLDGRWYIHYAAGSAPGLNDHKLYALVPGTPGQPLRPWVAARTGSPNGGLATNWKSIWAIDPDVFLASDNRYYLVYACRQDNSGSRESKFQSICLSAMSDPLHPTGQTIELSQPTQPWEIRTFPTQEGPFGFTHNGVDYILYSASFSGTPDDYSEGVLINHHPPQPNGAGNALTNPAAWIKDGPVFDGHHASYGTASNVLVDSPDGTELWNVYHGVNCLKNCTLFQGKIWRDRSDRAQQAGWSATGSLVMGYPVDIANSDGTGEGVPLATPSAGGNGTMSIPAWGAAFGDGAEGDPSGGEPAGTWTSSGPNAIASSSLDPNRFDRKFFGANPNWQEYVLSTRMQLVATGTGDAHPKYGVYGAYVDRNNYFIAMIDVTSCGSPGCVTTDAVVDGADRGWQNCTLPAGFNAASPNSFVVEAVTGKFTVSVNGTTLSGACQGRQFALSAGQASTHGSNGQVGVIVEDTKAQFTSFNVSPGVPLDSRKYSQIYAFRNQASGMNLDNACDGGCGSKAKDDAGVIQYPAAAPYPLTTSRTQLWTLQDRGGGYFAIVSVMSGMCLDHAARPAAPSGDLAREPRTSPWLRQRSCNGASSQQWRFIPATDSRFVIQNQASLQFLDSGGTSQGTEVRLKSRAETASQNWQLVVQ